MPLFGSISSPRGPRAPRAGGARFLALLLVLCLVPFTSNALTLERPSVDVDWDKLPQKTQNQPPLRYAPNRLFGTVEFRSAIKGLPQWERILRQYRNKTSLDADFIKTGRKTELQEWEKIKADAKSEPPLETMIAVNKFFNLWPHRADIDLYGLMDYWATPEEFIGKSGDCEDYSITKMFALIQLGFKPENMRVVVVRDKIRNLEHAVLAVYIGKDVLILDNTSPLVLSHSKYGHYLPIVSFNLKYKWAHVPPAR